jgi:imidazole glycerol phosphate synthase glutamine amidotransferase subunit
LLAGILNYGAGNLGSVVNALERLGCPHRFVNGPEELVPAGTPFDKLIFPGDGHFGTTMAALRTQGYDQALAEWFSADKPFLGICIGLQVLFEWSEEILTANHANDANLLKENAGLGVIKGCVKKFSSYKVPQIGWNQTQSNPQSKLFQGIKQNSFFYYIHSYYVAPDDSSVIAATADYGISYCSAVERGNLAAVQFHPEKSGETGLRLLQNWLEM